MKKLSIIIVAISLLTACNQNGSTTEGETFNLTKQGAHYVFTSSVNGIADATILLESGLPALLADSAYVFNTGALSDMNLSSTGGKEKLNLAGRVFVITHKANGRVRIGDNTSYVGEVFVLSGYDYGNYEVAVPVMCLHNDLDKGSRIVELDLSGQRMQMLSRASLRAKKADYTKLKMNINTYMNLPAVETSFTFNDGIKERSISGNFFVDFGNPEMLFLLHHDEETQRFLADNADMDIKDALDPNGNVFAQYFIASQGKLCGVAFSNAVVAVTKNLPLFDAPGDIGLKFFEQVNVIMDSDHLDLYMKQ